LRIVELADIDRHLGIVGIDVTGPTTLGRSDAPTRSA
jgi:hypothetical protein